MFDLICIFTKGGVVVWSKFFYTVSIELINVLIKNVLMEEKTAMNQFLYQNYLFKWRMENQSGLVFAVVYQEVLQLIYVDEFIEMLKDDYMEKAYKKIEFRDGFLATLPDYDNSGINAEYMGPKTPKPQNPKAQDYAVFPHYACLAGNNSDV
eukprot:TRINITY_DN7468_c0_g1_i3.p1 TRINITY_DN7468_c0_g1~~TRINITY_DN7468_c0_g1_i3.p1  ORF type:complete len:152 (+),score=31.29 TRINITY_DN7468_c0_g1_i3:97-552(+)